MVVIITVCFRVLVISVIIIVIIVIIVVVIIVIFVEFRLADVLIEMLFGIARLKRTAVTAGSVALGFVSIIAIVSIKWTASSWI